MAFYDLSKEERGEKVAEITNCLLLATKSAETLAFLSYFSDDDTYIRKTAYQAVGKIYFSSKSLHGSVLKSLNQLADQPDYKVRQTVINAAGEIGKKNFEVVQHFFDNGLFDPHHSPRNAVIGSIKKMGDVNPNPVLQWARKFLHHPEKEIRREICHGIELRGRKYPQDILPLLQELEFDETARVRKTLVHVIGQISYKKGCLETVITHLKLWKNRELVEDALEEIIAVHDRYRNFSSLTQAEAKNYINKNRT